MAPEVLLRKLTYLRQLLADLTPYRHASLAEVEVEHYKLERIFELLVVTATDILNHQLAELGLTPGSYREAYRLAAEQGFLPDDLAGRMQNAAGMRNVIVHMYETIDYAILRNNINPALHDFEEFVALFEARLDDEIAS